MWVNAHTSVCLFSTGIPHLESPYPHGVHGQNSGGPSMFVGKKITYSP